MTQLFDIIVILFILSFGILGYKRGIFKQTILLIGTVLMFVLAYKYKNVLGDFLVLKLPFFNFVRWGADSLNIIIYQAIAFFLIATVFELVFSILIAVTGLMEKLLKFTILLGLPSKILGFIAGIVEGYIITFVILFMIYQPLFNFELEAKSDLTKWILNESPILSKYCNDSLDLMEEIYDLTDITDSMELDREVVNLILEREVTTVDVIDKLILNDKLKIDGIEAVLNKYR